MLTIHRGNKFGFTIATGSHCLEKKSVTHLHFPESTRTVRLEHFHHKFLHFHGKTIFTYNGTKYHWKGNTVLVDDDTGEVLANFHSSRIDTASNKIGRLEVTNAGEKLLSLVVITALIVQEKSDENKRAVHL